MIEVGDYVEVVDDVLMGVVAAIDGNRITLETEDGFILEFGLDEVIKVQDMRINREELAKAVKQERKRHKTQSRISNKRKQEVPLEVDLHIENIVTSTRGLSDFQLLNLQLDAARSQLEFAIKKHIKRVIFIHGIGRGVLRAELETLLRRYENVEFYDANFQQYGRGATEVYIFQNGKN